MSFGGNTIITSLAVTGFLALSGTSLSWAGDLTTSDEIMHALAPEPILTRSLSGQHAKSYRQILVTEGIRRQRLELAI